MNICNNINETCAKSPLPCSSQEGVKYQVSGSTLPQSISFFGIQQWKWLPSQKNQLKWVATSLVKVFFLMSRKCRVLSNVGHELLPVSPIYTLKHRVHTYITCVDMQLKDPFKDMVPLGPIKMSLLATKGHV